MHLWQDDRPHRLTFGGIFRSLQGPHVSGRPRKLSQRRGVVMIRALALLTALFLTAHDAIGADAITGRASVIDGDTLEIHETRIRLYGIDAPESDQLCTVAGKQSRCGQRAALALADKIGSRLVACQPKDRDQYDRVVAVCRAGGEELNAWMAAQGWAMAYRQYSADYVPQEKSAAASKLGIWQGEFVPPWDWRRGKRLERK